MLLAWFRVIFFGSFLLAGSVNAAVQIADPYKAVKVVSEQLSSSEQNKAIQLGLEEVLVRNSGYLSVLLDPGIQRALSSSSEFLSQFSFESNSETRVNELGEVIGTKKLVMEFDPGLVNDLISNNGQTLWGPRRPQVLMWVAHEHFGQREILANALTPELQRPIENAARFRGVPVLLPEMDFEDELVINPLDVWGQFTDAVEDASERYQPDAILTGRIESLSNQRSRGTWTFIFNGEYRKFEITSDSLELLLAASIDQVAERLADQYAFVVDGNYNNYVQLEVANVIGLKDYHDVVEYMSGLTGVSSVQIKEISNDQLVMEIEVSGDLQQLKDIIALDDYLKPRDNLDQQETDVLITERVSYSWQPNLLSIQ